MSVCSPSEFNALTTSVGLSGTGMEVPLSSTPAPSHFLPLFCQRATRRPTPTIKVIQLFISNDSPESSLLVAEVTKSPQPHDHFLGQRVSVSAQNQHPVLEGLGVIPSPLVAI